MTKTLPTVDFETYSEAGYKFDFVSMKVKGLGVGGKGGLKEVGTSAYAEHHSCEVLTMSYDLLDGSGVRRWKPGDDQPSDLLNHVAQGGPVAAWNVTFEWFIWNFVCVRKYGWPPLNFEQCHCDMAKSRRYSMPGPLAHAAKVVGGAQKDKAGSNLIQKLTRPHTPTKNRLGVRRTRDTDPEDFAAFDQYCDQDVVAEMATAAHMPDLTTSERATWLADQRVNARGVQVDVAALDACLYIMQKVTERFTDELRDITCGAVSSVNAGAQFIAWLGSLGVHTHSIDADNVKEILGWESSRLPQPARRALEIRQALGGANIKKLPKLKLQLNSDGRLRNQYTYCGAATGRWSAGGVQLQNLTAKGPKSKTCDICGRVVGTGCRLEVMGARGSCPECGGNDWTTNHEWKVEHVEFAIADIMRRDLDRVIDVWGDPCTLLAGCLRGLFIAKEGHELICCDFSAIEAVVLACLSRCQWRIDVFNTHGEIYEMSASKITGIPFAEFAEYKAANDMHHPLRKAIGKVAELASGYGGWLGAWKAFGAEEHFDNDDEIKAQIIAWREASPEIVEFWGGQHRQTGAKPWDSTPELFGLEGAAVAAVLNPGHCFNVGDVGYGVQNDVLYCRLPSGRFLYYHRPRLDRGEDHFKRPSYKLTFEGYNSNAQKGPPGWQRMETYGGRLAENVTQAVAADIQSEALKRCEDSGYSVVMHTHDELTAEVKIGSGKTLAGMTELMTQRPEWASWWPIRGAGWTHKRYQKD